MKNKGLKRSALILAMLISYPSVASTDTDDLMQEYKILKRTVKELQLTLSIKCNEKFSEDYLIKHSQSLKKLLAMKVILLSSKKDIDNVLFNVSCPAKANTALM